MLRDGGPPCNSEASPVAGAPAQNDAAAAVADRGQVRASRVLESRRDRHTVYVNPDFAASALDFLPDESE